MESVVTTELPRFLKNHFPDFLDWFSQFFMICEVECFFTQLCKSHFDNSFQELVIFKKVSTLDQNSLTFPEKPPAFPDFPEIGNPAQSSPTKKKIRKFAKKVVFYNLGNIYKKI